MLPAMSRTTTLVAVVLAAVALVFTGWVLATPASACSCAGLATPEQFERADVVFAGHLVSREVNGGASSSDPALHVFAVDAVFKGTAHARQGVVSAASGASCGLELAGDGPFLVFAGGQDGGPHRADLCGGTAPAAPELVAEVRALSAAEGAAVAVDPLPGAAGTELRSAPQSWAGVLVVAGAGLALLTGLLARRSRHRRG